MKTITLPIETAEHFQQVATQALAMLEHCANQDAVSAYRKHAQALDTAIAAAKSEPEAKCVCGFREKVCSSFVLSPNKNLARVCSCGHRKACHGESK